RAEVCDLHHPRAHTTPIGVEGRCAPPHGEEDVLHDVFGGPPVEALQGQAEDGSSVPAMEQGKGLLGAAGDLTHQLGVVGLLCRRHRMATVPVDVPCPVGRNEFPKLCHAIVPDGQAYLSNYTGGRLSDCVPVETIRRAVPGVETPGGEHEYGTME